jgi:hypothetical protein
MTPGTVKNAANAARCARLPARAHGMFSNRRPAGTPSASASITIVGKRGARFPRSIFEIAVVCRPVALDRSSWDRGTEHPAGGGQRRTNGLRHRGPTLGGGSKE